MQICPNGCKIHDISKSLIRIDNHNDGVTYIVNYCNACIMEFAVNKVNEDRMIREDIKKE